MRTEGNGLGLLLYLQPPPGMGGTAKQIAIAAMAIALQLPQFADPLGPLQCNMPLIGPLAQGA